MNWTERNYKSCTHYVTIKNTFPCIRIITDINDEIFHFMLWNFYIYCNFQKNRIIYKSLIYYDTVFNEWRLYILHMTINRKFLFVRIATATNATLYCAICSVFNISGIISLISTFSSHKKNFDF